MQKIEKAISYKEKVYRELKAAIICQKLKSGEILNERKLAEDLGISRTPIREALHMLANEKWVVIEPYRGAYVYELTEKDIIEIFQVRYALECLAIELIVDNISQKDTQRLIEIFEKQEELNNEYNAEEFINVDRNFHTLIVELSGNKVLMDMLNDLGDVVRRLGMQAVQDKKRFVETIDEHLAIINAIKSRDKNKAIEAMKLHIDKTKDNIYERYIELQNGIGM